MSRQRTQLVGVFLIVGAAIGFTLGIIISDLALAAVFGAAGGGVGIVIGAAVDSLSGREPRNDQRG